jgi:acid phosphatase (class A)
MRILSPRSALALLLVLGPASGLGSLQGAPVPPAEYAPLLVPYLGANHAATAPPVPAPAPDYALEIGPFPAPGSDRAKADQAILLWLQRSRSREDIRRAESEVNLRLGLFSAATGRDLGSGQFPLTEGLVEQAVAFARPVVSSLKRRFARPRPYEVIPGLAPAITRENSFSYPSGHSTWGTLVSSILMQLEPQAREAILERGLQVGFDRALGGVHYPSDVEASQHLGFVLARAWLADPGNRLRLEQVRTAEW